MVSSIVAASVSQSFLSLPRSSQMILSTLQERLSCYIVPELKRICKDRRREILRSACKQCEKHPCWIGVVFGPSLGLVIVDFLCGYYFVHHLHLSALWGLATGIVIGFPVGCVFAFRQASPLLKRYVRRELRARGIDICQRCGYDMRFSHHTCPECGAIYDDVVDVSENPAK